MKSLKERVIEYNKEVKAAIELILSALNHGQREKVLKNEAVKVLVERYKIDLDGMK